MAILLKMGIGYHRNGLVRLYDEIDFEKFLHIFASDIQTKLFGKSKQKLATLPNLAQSAVHSFHVDGS